MTHEVKETWILSSRLRLAHHNTHAVEGISAPNIQKKWDKHLVQQMDHINKSDNINAIGRTRVIPHLGYLKSNGVYGGIQTATLNHACNPLQLWRTGWITNRVGILTWGKIRQRPQNKPGFSINGSYPHRVSSGWKLRGDNIYRSWWLAATQIKKGVSKMASSRQNIGIKPKHAWNQHLGSICSLWYIESRSKSNIHLWLRIQIQRSLLFFT